ncbi:MAG: hypothetical protein ACYTFK_02580 [Planctomycetota bacterium]|jgi:hypothetical protein
MKSHKKLIIAFAVLIAIGIAGVAVAAYTAYTAITNVSITSHSDDDIVYVNQEYTVTCTTSTDTDCHYEGGWHLESDPVTHTWTGDGSFAAPGTGTSLTWTAPASAGSATITVTADDSPLYNETAKQDSVTLTVLDVDGPEIELHTTSSYDDNGGDGLNDCQVHFGYRTGTGSAYPNIYIEITMYGGDSGAVDQIYVPVTSESDSTGISVQFTETGNDTDLYRTTLPIHLSTTSSQANLELEVHDEETLYVGGAAGPEVDRGEVSTISAYCFYGAAQAMADDGADAIEEFLDKDEAGNTYCWWDNGNVRNTSSTSTFGDFIKNVGTSSSPLPGDFMFSVSHGDSGNFGYLSGSPSIYKPGGGTPTVTSTDWDNDVEWIITYTCHGLGQDAGTTPSAWIGYWDDALKNKSGDNIAHAILSSSDLLWAAPTEDHMLAMCDAIKDNNETIVGAYIDTALEVVPKQWSASYLSHNENTGDKLNNVTQDTTGTMMTYGYYSDFSGYYDDNDYPTPNDPNFPDPCDPNIIYQTWGGGGQFSSGVSAGYEILCDIPTDQPELRKVLVHKEVLNQNALDHAGFKKVKFNNSGRVKFKKVLAESGSVGLSKAQARAKADRFVSQRGGGMPADADVVLVRKGMVLTCDSLDPVGTQREYVRKGFFEYRHKVNGIEVVGGNRGDSIFVTIADGDVVGFNRHWRDIVGPVGAAQEVISASDALDVAVENIPNVMLGGIGGYSITDAKLFYYGLPSEPSNQFLTPVWGFELNKCVWVYVNAFTGEFLK